MRHKKKLKKSCVKRLQTLDENASQILRFFWEEFKGKVFVFYFSRIKKFEAGFLFCFKSLSY